MSKATKNERISTLERQLTTLTTLVKMKGYHEVDQRVNQIADQLARQQGVISKLSIMVKEQNEAILMLEKLTDEKLRDQPEPQLKQLDQSIFDDGDSRHLFAAVDKSGDVWLYREEPKIDEGDDRWSPRNRVPVKIGTDYDASNWQNSLIERDIAKELLEVDLSSELTGSELCRAMLARGDKFVMCHVGINKNITVITGWNGNGFTSVTNQDSLYLNPTPINNQGEPLTASEVGL